MAEYIDDSGSHGYDALLSGTKGGAGTDDYDYNYDYGFKRIKTKKN